MKIRILSDLHLEFMGNDWLGFMDGMPKGADVLVLAGDIANGHLLRPALRRFARRFGNVVYVTGNHEFYGSSPSEVEQTLASDLLPDNLHHLECGTVAIGSLGLDGQRFLGATLWFEDPPIPGPYQSDPRHGMNDFFTIREFEPWVYEQNRRTREWLHDNVRAGDVVVTHHLPSGRSTHPKYVGSSLNRFFLGCMDMSLERLIQERQPALWIHGHTHESCDYRIGRTRVVCNPYGYHQQEVNAAFDPGLTVEVSWP